MKNTLVFIYLLVCFQFVFAQNNWTTNVIDENSTGTIRALIIGVSTYSNLPVNKQLLYADDDAKMFYDYLKSRNDIVKPENIIALFNEQATGKMKIMTYLYDFLVKESKPNDVVIIYFAGHGDIQNLNSQTEKGFLLLSNVTNDGDYMAPTNDVISVSELKQYLSYVKEGVKVIVIIDACRSGKLVNTEGSQKVLTALNAEWSNTFKLVSCQPDQSSFEDQKWGGGHGVFTYYLVYGLEGLADENNNNLISFGELFDYIKSNVKKETNYKQIPKAEGNEAKPIINVNAKIKELAEQRMKKNITSDENTLAMRSISDANFLSDNVPIALKNDITLLQTLVSEKLFLTQKKIVEIDKEIELEKPVILNNHEKNTFSCDLTFDAKKGITGGQEGLKVWNLETKTIMSNLNQKGVLCMKVSSITNKLYSAGWDNKIKVWNLNTNEKEAELISHNNDIRAMALNENYLITGGDDSKICIWNTKNNNLKNSFKRLHKNRVSGIELINNNSFVTVGLDGFIYVRDINTGKIIKSLSIGSSIQTLAKKGNQIIVGTKSGNVIILNTDNLKIIHKFSLGYKINALITSSSGKYIFAGGNSLYLSIISTEDYKVLKKIKLPKSITDIKLSGNEKKIIVSMYGGKSAIIGVKNLCHNTNNVSAIEVYNNMVGKGINNPVIERAKYFLITALNKETHNLLQNLIDGKTLPKLSDIEYAMQCEKQALKLAESDELISKNIEVNISLLKILKIIVESDFLSYAKAITLLKEIEAQYPDASYTHNLIAEINMKLMELKKAKKEITICMKNIPDWIDPKINLGKTYFIENKYDKAINIFDEIITKAPENSKAYFYKAQVLAYIGKKDMAKTCYNKAINLDNDNAIFKFEYFKSLVSFGEIKTAEKIINKITNTNIYYHLAQIILLESKLKNLNKINKVDISAIKLLIDSLHYAEQKDSTNLDVIAEKVYVFTTIYNALNKVDKKQRDTIINKIKNTYNIQNTSKSRRVLLTQAKKTATIVLDKRPFDLKMLSYKKYISYLKLRNVKSSKRYTDNDLFNDLKKLTVINNIKHAEPLYYYSLFTLNNKKAIKALNKALKIDHYYYQANARLYELTKKQ
jgi:WD40 repeat protein